MATFVLVHGGGHGGWCYNRVSPLLRARLRGGGRRRPPGPGDAAAASRGVGPAGGRVGKLVCLDAAHPKNGEALADVAPGMMAMAQAEMWVADGVELVMSPDSRAIPHLGVTDPADFAWMKSKITPHPWKCFTQKLILKDEAAVRALPRFNINCSTPIRTSDAASVARQLDGDRNFEIDTGHDLMITEPRAVADMLLEIAAA